MVGYPTRYALLPARPRQVGLCRGRVAAVGTDRGQWNGLTALPLGGRPSKDECGQERAKREEAQAELRIAVYNCLPDTVDPRGPRGSEEPVAASPPEECEP